MRYSLQNGVLEYRPFFSALPGCGRGFGGDIHGWKNKTLFHRPPAPGASNNDFI